MAEKAASLMRANVGLSVTGNAGPTSGDGKSEVGRFYIALAAPGVIGDTVCITRKMSRSRNDIREVASSAALDLIRKSLKTV
jgi:nicotinamide mononucleotide (NMN) deamidase PncC